MYMPQNSSPARESGTTRAVVGPNIRSRDQEAKWEGFSCDTGPHMLLSSAARSMVVCCWNSRYICLAILNKPAPACHEIADSLHVRGEATHTQLLTRHVCYTTCFNATLLTLQTSICKHVESGVPFESLSVVNDITNSMCNSKNPKILDTNVDK